MSSAQESVIGGPLPELQDAVLAPDVLAKLFSDLGSLPQVLEIRVKGHATAYGVEVPPSLDEARAALGAGASVQLRYSHQGSLWCDTLMPASGGVRLVRVKMAT
jgi:hypothetical protein